jgi:DNA invertase Pin-like site-specific DNA recombinase
MSDTGTIYGYARVSTADQNHDLQIDALVKAGVPLRNITVETISGAEQHKPEFEALRAKLKPGDTLAVWKVDRLGRNTLDAIHTSQELDKAGVHIVITTLGIDLKTPSGRLVFGMMCQIAEFERELIRERVTAGMAAAKTRGIAIGRHHTLTTHQRSEAARMVNVEGKSLAQVAAIFGCARSVVHRAATEARGNGLGVQFRPRLGRRPKEATSAHRGA